MHWKRGRWGAVRLRSLSSCLHSPFKPSMLHPGLLFCSSTYSSIGTDPTARIVTAAPSMETLIQKRALATGSAQPSWSPPMQDGDVSSWRGSVPCPCSVLPGHCFTLGWTVLARTSWEPYPGKLFRLPFSISIGFPRFCTSLTILI